MNVYYNIERIGEKYAHISFMINKKDLVDKNDIRRVMQFLIDTVRQSKGALGLLESRGSEYWVSTTNPVHVAEFGRML